MLTQLKLTQYIDKFEEEGMEMSVLIALARGVLAASARAPTT